MKRLHAAIEKETQLATCLIRPEHEIVSHSLIMIFIDGFVSWYLENEIVALYTKIEGVSYFLLKKGTCLKKHSHIPFLSWKTKPTGSSLQAHNFVKETLI